MRLLSASLLCVALVATLSGTAAAQCHSHRPHYPSCHSHSGHGYQPGYHPSSGYRPNYGANPNPGYGSTYNPGQGFSTHPSLAPLQSSQMSAPMMPTQPVYHPPVNPQPTYAPGSFSQPTISTPGVMPSNLNQFSTPGVMPSNLNQFSQSHSPALSPDGRILWVPHRGSR